MAGQLRILTHDMRWMPCDPQLLEAGMCGPHTTDIRPGTTSYWPNSHIGRARVHKKTWPHLRDLGVQALPHLHAAVSDQHSAICGRAQ